jgi:hypothetical protein
MFERTISEPDVPRPDRTTVTIDPLSRLLITQLVSDVFLQDPIEDFTVTD